MAGFRDRFIAAARFILQDREIPPELQDWLESSSAQALPTCDALLASTVVLRAALERMFRHRKPHNAAAMSGCDPAAGSLHVDMSMCMPSMNDIYEARVAAALMGGSPIWHMQRPPAPGEAAPVQPPGSTAAVPPSQARQPASSQAESAAASAAAPGLPAEGLRNAQPPGDPPSTRPQQRASATSQSAGLQAQQTAAALPGAGQPFGAPSSGTTAAATDMQGLAPFNAILQQLQQGLGQAAAAGQSTPAHSTAQAATGLPAASSAQVPPSGFTFGDIGGATTGARPQMPPGLPQYGPGNPVLVGMQSMQVTIGPEGVMSASVGQPVSVTDQVSLSAATALLACPHDETNVQSPHLAVCCTKLLTLKHRASGPHQI